MKMIDLSKKLEQDVLDALEKQDIEAQYNTPEARACMQIIAGLLDRGWVTHYHQDGRTFYRLVGGVAD